MSVYRLCLKQSTTNLRNQFKVRPKQLTRQQNHSKTTPNRPQTHKNNIQPKSPNLKFKNPRNSNSIWGFLQNFSPRRKLMKYELNNTLPGRPRLVFNPARPRFGIRGGRANLPLLSPGLRDSVHTRNEKIGLTKVKMRWRGKFWSWWRWVFRP